LFLTPEQLSDKNEFLQRTISEVKEKSYLISEQDNEEKENLKIEQERLVGEIRKQYQETTDALLEKLADLSRKQYFIKSKKPECY